MFCIFSRSASPAAGAAGRTAIPALGSTSPDSDEWLPLLPLAGSQGKLRGLYKWWLAKNRQALSGLWEEKEKGCPSSLVPLDGAPTCTLTHSLTSPLV